MDEKEKDLELEESIENELEKEGKEEAKILEWFEEVCIEDKLACLTVGGTARSSLFEIFNIGITRKALLLMYAKTYENIIKALVSKRADVDSFVIEIADMLKVGYNNVSDKGDKFEVAGNFNIFIQDTGRTPAFTKVEETVAGCTEWNSKNITNQIKVINEIASGTIADLKDYNLIVGFPELIFPVFCVVHKTLIKFVDTKRTEEGVNDYFINFCGCFDIHAMKMEDKSIAIVFKPNISEKLNIKSNMIATAPTE